MPFAEVLWPVTSAVSILLLLWILHKLRRVHLMMFEVSENARVARFEAASVYRQIESLGALQRLLDLKEALPPLRGWAGSPDFLLALARHVMAKRPRVIFECSSGTSTLVLARCLAMLGQGGHVYSLEHDANYAEATRRLLATHGVAGFATVLHAELVPLAGLADHTAPWYALDGRAAWPRNIEMVVIDGPPGRGAQNSRYPALPILRENLAEECSIFLDDADRPDEQWAVAQWRRAMPELQAEQLDCEKGCVRLWREAR